jgi:hypothetical protein
MSLQLAAQHLSNQGRGPDDTLVHMTKNELRSLSDLAQSQGGQLTINPHTGLPEAGLLDNLLPTIIGAGISYFSGGAISPGMIGLGLGGFEAVRTGSLEKGLMAGLGAYGGAGLTAGLAGVGAAEIGMGARDAAVKSATEQGLTGEAYNKAIQEQVTQQMAEKATPFGSISAGTSELFKNPMQTISNMGGEGGGWQTAKYAAGAAAPYLADAYKPTTDMPIPEKPVEYRQYKVKRRPDMSYDYQALPVSKTFTPNFAEGGGISEAVGQYVDPSFKFKNVSSTPKIQTTTNMPELKLAGGGRITPEEFFEKYMNEDAAAPPKLKYGAKGYADDVDTVSTNPYERTEATPADIVGVDGETYTWDATLGKYVVKPKTVVATTPGGDTDTNVSGRGGGGISNTGNQTPGTTALPTSMVEGGGNITPLAYPSLALKKMGEAISLPISYLTYKLSPARQGEPAPVSDSLTFNESPNFTQVEGLPNTEVNQQVIDAFTQALINQQNNPLTQDAFITNSVADADGTVTVGEGEVVSDAPSEAPSEAPSVTVAPSDGGGSAALSGLSGVGPGPGVATTTPGNAVSSAMGGQSAAAGGGGSGATSGVSGVSGPGVASTAPGNAVSSAMGGQSAAATGGGRGGSTGGGTSGVSGVSGPGVASTSPGNAVSSAMGGQSAAATGGGGGGGGGGGCCFIMLEARYGDGTMDSVVRRYRDEKMTDKNRRGYYKLAEVFVPLMRESKLFKFMVTKTFADPLVSYGKYHYGENKHGWLFKPVEKFWMKVFNTLGTDTKFIRENGEVV